MSTVIEVAAEDENRPLRSPLLHRSSHSALHSVPAGDTDRLISTSAPPSDHTTQSPPPTRRLASLDVFRGLTVALMILVDDAGGAIPSINHSPWFGVTLADFVMPFFLFGVGISVALVFKKISSKAVATKKVIMRTIKLFLLGLLLQGGYFHGRKRFTFGVDVGDIRLMGVLQRISIGYFLASISEIWLVKSSTVDSPVAFVRKYYIQWIIAVLLCALYMSISYGLFVPDWEFEAQAINFAVNQSVPQVVHCDVRGSLEPPCNAVGFIDRYLIGQTHLYQHPVYRRTKECSVNSPDYGPLPPNSPVWCLAPFDPEGILSSLMAAITCFIGLHFGHIIVHVENHMQRLYLWLSSSIFLLLSGYLLEFLGIPLSKPLYTLSYMCVTAGASGLLLTLIFYLVDVNNIRKPMLLLKWMGMNALVVYSLAACELFSVVIQGFYWHSPQNNLVDAAERSLQDVFRSRRLGTLAFVLLEILFWGIFAGFLHLKKIYIKL